MKTQLLLLTMCTCFSHVQATTLNIDSSVPYPYVYSISELNIGGTFYDVTFHPGKSFNQLFDPDGDRNLEVQPRFWEDEAGANAAANSITTAIGADLSTAPSSESDWFLVPYQPYPFSIYSIDFYGDYKGPMDLDQVAQLNRLRTEINLGEPIVTFAISTVPIPPAFWLFSAGLLGLIGITRRKKLA